jgi:hypothetical protein
MKQPAANALLLPRPVLRERVGVRVWHPHFSSRKTPQMVTGEHAKFPHLFSPFKIRNLLLGNRIVISAHFAGWWVDGGLPSEAFVA